jgi:transposase
MPGRTFSREFKLDVVREIEEGHKRPAQACREYQLADSLLTRWRQEYRQRGEAAFTPREGGQPSALEARVAELERFCGQLALENAALKKALQSYQALPGTPPRSGTR